MDNRKEPTFVVMLGLAGEKRPIFQSGYPLGRLLDEVVVPHETDEKFLVAGRWVERGDGIESLRVIRGDSTLVANLFDIHRAQAHGAKESAKSYEQYALRVIGAVEAFGEDITAQVLSAYKRTLKDKLSEWVPKNKADITAKVMATLLESLEALGG